MKHTIALVAIILTLAILGLIAFSVVIPADAAQDRQLSIYSTDTNTSYYDTILVIDEVTGVNYVVIARLGRSVSITPRLNADGSLYVTP